MMTGRAHIKGMLRVVDDDIEQRRIQKIRNGEGGVQRGAPYTESGISSLYWKIYWKKSPPSLIIMALNGGGAPGVPPLYPRLLRAHIKCMLRVVDDDIESPYKRYA